MDPSTTVRTRVAPSPTGDPHIGTAYIALFNYAFARAHGGQFVLRIEDTDQARSSRESEEAILESLAWTGLAWDEGPDLGGPFGPYRQSERTELYRAHCDKLLESGAAYRCFCTPEELDKARNEPRTARQPGGYDKFCLSLGSDEARARVDRGDPYVVRLDVPDEGDCVMPDLLRGDVRTAWSTVDDQVLMKSDGFPTYHLASVVDDHLMQITHVIRGEEWINSTPKHLRLYEAFGWRPPTFCHLPLLRNPDKSKLSKRKNPTSIRYYRDAGLLPEAVLNYLGLMGYSMPDERDMFSLEEFVAEFDIRRVSLGGPIFDLDRMRWLNGRYLREALDPDAILERLKDWRLNDATWRRIVEIAQPRIDALSDLVPMTAFLFADTVAPSPDDLLGKKLDAAATARILKIGQWELESLRPWTAQGIHGVFQRIAEKEDLKLRDVVAPFYAAVSGAKSAPPLFDSMEILGSDISRRRIAAAIDILGEAGSGLSKKDEKKLEKDYRARYFE